MILKFIKDNMRIQKLLGAFSVSLVLIACGDDTDDVDGGMDSGTDDSGTDSALPDASDGGSEGPTYAFESRFIEGESSVSYSGQTFRHVLIDDLNTFVENLGDAIDRGAPGLDSADGIVGALNFYFRFDDAGLEEPIRLSTEPSALQETYGDISSTKSLDEKIAGGDPSRQHRDWTTEFAGWSSPLGATTPTSPTEFVDALFAEIGRLGELRANGEGATGPDGELLPPYVTPEGLDLKQLLQKFLLAAVAFSQGVDDYLDEGLMAENTQSEDAAYSSLEHGWDEGFGYYGATRDFDLYTTEEIASESGRADWQGAHDSDGDGAIDLRSERFFGAAINAAKRDLGSTSGTEFGARAFSAFQEGRALIAGGEESDALLTRLGVIRDDAVLAWEQAIAATAVHYINDVVADLESLGGDDYSFVDHAKHWAELKGFAFSFQFNPRSPVSAEDFVSLHALIGDAPELTEEGQAAAIDDLIAARDILQASFGFSDDDVANW